jgi:hypothetical protein
MTPTCPKRLKTGQTLGGKGESDTIVVLARYLTKSESLKLD